MAIFLKGWILPIGAALSGRVCACSLHSRLVFYSSPPKLFFYKAVKLARPTPSSSLKKTIVEKFW